MPPSLCVVMPMQSSSNSEFIRSVRRAEFLGELRPIASRPWEVNVYVHVSGVLAKPKGIHKPLNLDVIQAMDPGDTRGAYSRGPFICSASSAQVGGGLQAFQWVTTCPQACAVGRKHWGP